MYQPETQWIGGVYPGATSTNLHQLIRKVRYVSGNSLGHKRKAIVEYVRLNAPCHAVEIANAVGYPLDSVRGQLRIAFLQKLVTKELRIHPNGNNRIAYYSGVQ